MGRTARQLQALMFKQFSAWLDDRTGIPSAIHHFLNEDIPASAGWRQVLGSVALFAFLIQVVTGLLLALNYGGTPSEAHASIRYIMTEVTGGAMIRGLHHWGSSAMIIVVVLHMAQVFLWGAYKKPREATWIVGCILLLLTLAFGLSGYLLPWDNRAYWGTVVTTQIAGLAPGAGTYVKRLLGAEGAGIGAITFSRFYAAHIMLLPLATVLLIGLHLYLVLRHGVTPTPEDDGRPKKKFFPEQAFKDTCAIFAYVITLALLANFAKVGLGAMADPTDTSYVPRPEWYFLFLFQVLRLFEGPLEVVGAVVLPTIAMIVLILAPFLDRGQMMRVQKRTLAIAMVAFAAIGWAGLTQRAVATTPPSLEDPEAGLKPPALWREIPAEQLAAVGYFRKSGCAQCHTLGRSSSGPDLAKAPSAKSPDWLAAHFARPELRLTGPQIKALVTLVTKRDEKGLEAWEYAPEEAVAGAMYYQARQCGACHTLNGVGGSIAPPMNGLSTRHTKAWVTEHFADPKKLVPNSVMPAFNLPPQELASVTDYILSIPK
jgi:ubiquinol-cytochrome c reductase cytochrome b subunit